MKNEYELFDKTDFGKIYRKMTADCGLMTAIVQMESDEGINEQKAYELADELIHKMALHQGIENYVREDPENAMDDYLTGSKQLQGYDRKLLLHQLNFGLHLYQDADLIERLKEGSTIDELFREYYDNYGDDPAYSEDRLADEIRLQVSTFRIPPKAIKAIAKKLEKSDDLVADSAALSEEGLRFKCIVAMNLYLNNRETMSIDDAVSTACTDIEIEAVADAVARGQMATDTAHKILTALFIATVLFSLTAWVGGIFISQGVGVIPKMLTIPYAELPLDMAKTAVSALAASWKEISLNLFMGGGVIALTTDVIADAVGKLASKYHFYYSKNTHSAANDMSELSERFAQMYAAQDKEQNTAKWVAREGMKEEDFQEENTVLF